eukprot:15122434-Heterocapsa_arctica.AAC.1
MYIKRLYQFLADLSGSTRNGLAGCLAGWIAGILADLSGSTRHELAGWLSAIAGWLDGWLAGWLAGILNGS